MEVLVVKLAASFEVNAALRVRTRGKVFKFCHSPVDFGPRECLVKDLYLENSGIEVCVLSISL